MIGNGGSAATAAHLACDLYKGCGLRSRALVASMPLFSALGNDCGYDQVFAWQVERDLKAGDCLVAISASGASANVLEAVAKARELGGRTVGLVGYEGGRLKEMVDCSIWVKSDCIEQVEDAHVVICHLLACYLRGGED